MSRSSRSPRSSLATDASGRTLSSWSNLLYDCAEESLSEARASTTQVQPIANARRDADKGVYMALSMVRKGKVLELIKCAPRTRRFEAWGKLVPGSGLSQTAPLKELGRLLNFDFGTQETSAANLFEWETAVTQYEVATGEPSTDNTCDVQWPSLRLRG